jgi:3-oxoadipate enol-lactonase
LQIERDGAQLFSTTLGSGPDVVLLHPTPTHHAFWLPVAELLASQYRLTLPDLRGHGRSTLGSGPITMEKLALDLHAVLQAAKIERAAFVGCSIGGYLLYEYWRRFPAQVAALAFICGKPQPDSATSLERRKEWMHSAQQSGGLEKFFDLMADTLVGPTAQQRDPRIRTAARAMMEPVTLDAMLAVQQGLGARPDSLPTLGTIDVPICAIAGGEDQSSTPPEMQVIAEQAPNAEFHLLANAGHYAPMEQPKMIAEILGDFLNRHYPSVKTSAGHAR